MAADRNLSAQQNITAAGIAVVLVRGSTVAQVGAQSEALSEALSSAALGTVIRVPPDV